MNERITKITDAANVPPAIRAQIERFMSDPMRCMPSERERLEQMGFGTKETTQENTLCLKKTP